MTRPDLVRTDGLVVPLAERLPAGSPRFAVIMALHGEAMTRHKVTYRDPSSGYSVFTAKFLADRGYCCASGCRHCPFEQLP